MEIVVVQSYLRGHELIMKDGKWVYADDLSDIPANGGKLRPCKQCGRSHELTDADPCLGVLPGVKQACCGHGKQNQSYIIFKNGVIIEEFKITKEKNS